MWHRSIALLTTAAISYWILPAAEAGYVITLTSGSETVVLQNSGSGFSASGSGYDAFDFASQSTSLSLGGPRVRFEGTVGSFSLELNISTSYPGKVNPIGAMISDLALTANNLGTAASVLDINVLFEDWTLPGLPGDTLTLINSLATSQVDSGGSITFGSFADSVITDPITLTTSPAQGQSEVRFVRDLTFDMGNHVTVRLDQGGVASFDGNTHAIAPEAASVVIWGLTAAGFIGFLYRQRRHAIRVTGAGVAVTDKAKCP
jgi:hypothetical protein